MILLYPLSLFMALIVGIRETLYRFYFIRSYSVQTKVLSVGNLTFGGTGKTPTVDYLLNELKSQKKIAVISRGYGRKTSGFFKVNPNNSDAVNLYGDEPVQLAIKHPEVPFYVSEDRVSGCKKIEKDGNFDLILADDAFQHLSLKRDIDIVVIDASEKPTHYQYPPVGRARNSLCYLKRADFVFLTKTNLASQENLHWIRKKIKKSKVFEFESKLDGVFDLKTNQKVNLTDEVYLMSGIGKPYTFEKLMSTNFPNLTIKGHFKFEDHKNYSEGELNKVKAIVEDNVVVTTEKDAVKLKNTEDLNLCVAKIEFVCVSGNPIKEILK